MSNQTPEPPARKPRFPMDWTFIAIIVALFGAFLLWKSLTTVSADAARRHLAAGALVIDVRSPGEFRGNHLPGALNIPLDELPARLPEAVPDRDRTLLLHCLSGTRSAIACKQARQLGYRNVHNLGSLGRASKIVGTAR